MEQSVFSISQNKHNKNQPIQARWLVLIFN